MFSPHSSTKFLSENQTTSLSLPLICKFPQQLEGGIHLSIWEIIVNGFLILLCVHLSSLGLAFTLITFICFGL